MENREKLLSCALDLFYARGYDAVGIQEIVDKAGVTKPTMYYYFGSKKGLLEALIQHSFTELMEAMETAARRQPQERFPQVLYRVAQTFLTYAISHEKEYKFSLALYYTGAENEGHIAVQPWVSRYYQRMVQLFLEAKDELGNMNGRQEQFAQGFQGLLDAAFLIACGRQETEITEEKIRNIVQQFMYGIYS